MKQKVLVVDDSPFIRRIISDWVKGESDMELVGQASNGSEAIEAVKALNPDVITLDVEMPVCDGISALREIMTFRPTGVIMVSSVTTQSASATLQALELGALDFVTKPEGSSRLKVLGCKAELLEKIRAAKTASLERRGAFRMAPITPPISKMTSDKVVLIAASTGGPKALAQFWQQLPKGFPCPILIVQHMPAGFTESFAKRLNSLGTVPCKQAIHGEKVVPGLALIAPGGHHMLVSKNGTIELNVDPIVHGTRPAADPLFYSAVKLYKSRLIGAVFTGMGRDGADGAAAVIKAGGQVFGQDEATCTIYGMPKAALQAGGITAEYPLEKLAGAITTAVKGKIAHAS